MTTSPRTGDAARTAARTRGRDRAVRRIVRTSYTDPTGSGCGGRMLPVDPGLSESLGRCQIMGSHVPASAYDGVMKGDRVEVTVDTGGSVQRFEIEATRS